MTITIVIMCKKCCISVEIVLNTNANIKCVLPFMSVRLPFLLTNRRLLLPIHSLVCLATFSLSLPLAISLFPQMSQVLLLLLSLEAAWTAGEEFTSHTLHLSFPSSLVIKNELQRFWVWRYCEGLLGVAGGWYAYCVLTSFSGSTSTDRGVSA